MSKTVNPLGFRLGINQYWNTKFYLFDYVNSFKKQLLIQNLLYCKLARVNVKILQYSLYKDVGSYFLNANIYIAPTDISTYISKLLFRRYFTYLLKRYKNNKRIKRNKLKRKAQLFVTKYIKITRKFYFLSIILIKLELERLFTNFLRFPVKIILNNMYYYNLKKRSKALRKKLLKKFFFYKKKNKSFNSLIAVLNVAFRFSSAALIAQVIVQEMQKVKKHLGLLKMLQVVFKNFLKISVTQIRGIKIKISGKMNGKLRANSQVFHIGIKVPSQTLNANITYSFLEAFTYTGVFGIKVWLYLRDTLHD